MVPWVTDVAGVDEARDAFVDVLKQAPTVEPVTPMIPDPAPMPEPVVVAPVSDFDAGFHAAKQQAAALMAHLEPPLMHGGRLTLEQFRKLRGDLAALKP
jgi:hypothetical protein